MSAAPRHGLEIASYPFHACPRLGAPQPQSAILHPMASSSKKPSSLLACSDGEPSLGLESSFVLEKDVKIYQQGSNPSPGSAGHQQSSELIPSSTGQQHIPSPPDSHDSSTQQKTPVGHTLSAYQKTSSCTSRDSTEGSVSRADRQDRESAFLPVPSAAQQSQQPQQPALPHEGPTMVSAPTASNSSSSSGGCSTYSSGSQLSSNTASTGPSCSSRASSGRAAGTTRTTLPPQTPPAAAQPPLQTGLLSTPRGMDKHAQGGTPGSPEQGLSRPLPSTLADLSKPPSALASHPAAKAGRNATPPAAGGLGNGSLPHTGIGYDGKAASSPPSLSTVDTLKAKAAAYLLRFQV